jgi:putative NADH-flavin reductase
MNESIDEFRRAEPQMNRVIVFGASGATGREIVAAALARQWAVTAFVRRSERAPPGARVIVGNVDDAQAVAAAIAGHDAVISALGVGKPLASDPAVVRGVGHIVEGMHAHGVRRLVYMSFIGVRESRQSAGWLIRNVARHPLHHEIADHERKEALIKGSSLDWTIVRPPKLTNGPRTARYRSGALLEGGAFFPRLARADVAAFMVDTVLDRATYCSPTLLLPA